MLNFTKLCWKVIFNVKNVLKTVKKSVLNNKTPAKERSSEGYFCAVLCGLIF